MISLPSGVQSLPTTVPASWPRLVVLEGPDGVGKSTQARLLVEWLERSGERARLSREPGGDAFAESIRDLLLATRVDPRTELLCFEAARVRHLETVVNPLLAKGWWVVLDRFSPSTLVYQGEALGVETVLELERLLSIPLPGLTVVLERSSPLVAMEVGDPYERGDLELWTRRMVHYRELAGELGWVTVSGEGGEEEVAGRIRPLLRGVAT